MQTIIPVFETFIHYRRWNEGYLLQNDLLMDDPYVNAEETVGHPPERKTTDGLLRKVAERIIAQSRFGFLDESTGICQEECNGLPVRAGIRLASAFNDWKYYNGVILLGLWKLGEILGEPAYRAHVRGVFAFGFRNLGYFKKLFDAGIPDASFHQYFRLDRLDDFGAMGAALADVCTRNPEPEYNDYLEKVAGYISVHQDRLKDGTFIRKRFGITSLWADDLFMSVPLLMKLYRLTGKEAYLEDAILQSDRFHYYLFDPVKGLYSHCCYPDTGKRGVAFWGRANGWVMMARTMLMDLLPADHPYRQTLQQVILEQVTGISRYQGPDGRWHQLLDRIDSFMESSCTAMFAYGIARAVNRGWIPGYYASVAVRAWEGLIGQVTQEGDLSGVSSGFNIRQDLVYYYNRPLEQAGEHGLGAFLLAGAEMRSMNSFRDCVWC